MKKIALLLVFVMIFGCCLCLSSCEGDSSENSNENTNKSLKEQAQDAVKNRIIEDVDYMTLQNIALTFVSCTYGTTQDLGDNKFKISGMFKVRKNPTPPGFQTIQDITTVYIADYEAEAEYDTTYGDWEVKIDYGTFKKM